VTFAAGVYGPQKQQRDDPDVVWKIGKGNGQQDVDWPATTEFSRSSAKGPRGAMLRGRALEDGGACEFT